MTRFGQTPKTNLGAEFCFEGGCAVAATVQLVLLPAFILCSGASARGARVISFRPGKVKPSPLGRDFSPIFRALLRNIGEDSGSRHEARPIRLTAAALSCSISRKTCATGSLCMCSLVGMRIQNIALNRTTPGKCGSAPSSSP